MNIALTKSEITGKLLAIVFAIACCVGHFYYNDATLIYNCCLLVCAILLVRSVKHKYLFLFACFVSTYILFLYPYFINNLSIGIYYEISGPSSYQKAIFLFSIFLTSLLFFFKDQPNVPVADRLPVYDSNIVFFINIMVMVAIIFFGASGESIISASYGSNRTEISTIYVYFPVFFLAAYLSSGRRKMQLYLMHIVGFAFVLKSLLLGGRGNTITMGLIIYLLFFDSRMSFPTFILVLVVGFVFFALFGYLRAAKNLTSINLADAFAIGSSYRDKYVAASSNQTDVFYASVRIITMVDTGIITTLERIWAFALFCVSIFVPYSILPPLANLSNYKLDVYNSLGGGLIFAYFYTYLSYGGIILAGYLVNKVWDNLRTSESLYTLVYSILVFATMNGWFAYNPITLFKLCLWAVFYIFAMDMLNKALKRRKAW